MFGNNKREMQQSTENSLINQNEKIQEEKAIL